MDYTQCKCKLRTGHPTKVVFVDGSVRYPRASTVGREYHDSYSCAYLSSAGRFYLYSYTCRDSLGHLARYNRHQIRIEVRFVVAGQPGIHGDNRKAMIRQHRLILFHRIGL